MKAGVIGVTSGSHGKIPSIVSTYERNNKELKTCIEINNTFTLDNGTTAQVGQVAKQKPQTEDSISIENGKIKSTEKNTVTTKHTHFVSVESELVIVQNGNGVFAYDIIGRETDTVIQRANLALDDFHKQHPEGDYWQAGFYGKDSDAENGAIYGSNVFSDNEIGKILESTDLNQIGAEYAYNDELIKLNITESGYVNVFHPDFSSKEFIEFVLDEISHIAFQ
jgi:hypothetical protein